MMAWLAYMVPVQTGIATFAEVARDPARLDDTLARSLRSSLTLGCATAIGLVILAGPLLSLLGPSYAEDGSTPLRVLAAGVVPVSFTYAYFAACRGLREPQRAIPLGWGGVGLVLLLTVPALELGGLTAMAVASPPAGRQPGDRRRRGRAV
jgi:Na+-driven multidrug efflux pump